MSQNVLLVIIVTIVAILVLASTFLDDPDPQGFYRVLGLSAVVRNRITCQQVHEHHAQVQQQLRDGLESQDCDKDEDIHGSDSVACKELKANLALANEALSVLGEPESKHAYDTRQEQLKDYWAVFNLTRDATLEQVRSTYLVLVNKLVDRSNALGCKSARTSTNSEQQAGGSGVVEECERIRRQHEELNEAVSVLASRAVYQQEHSASEGLNFVSSPLKLVSGPNPMSFIAPILVVFMVLYYISRLTLQRDQQETREILLATAVRAGNATQNGHAATNDDEEGSDDETDAKND